MKSLFLPAILFSVMFFISACDDQGDPVSVTVTPPTLLSIVPDSGAVGDTVIINGAKFGSAQGASSINFGTITASVIISWNDSTIKVKVPANSITDDVIIKVNGASSSGKQFKVLGTVTQVSFINDIRPLITSYNCASCHPGNGGFSVATYATIIAGGSTGNTVLPGNGDGSNLVKKLRGTAGFGSRMPQGGSPMSNGEIQKIVDWINQGALNN